MFLLTLVILWRVCTSRNKKKAGKIWGQKRVHQEHPSLLLDIIEICLDSRSGRNARKRRENLHAWLQGATVFLGSIEILIELRACS